MMNRSLLLLVLLGMASAKGEAQERPPLTPDQEAALYGIPALVTAGGTLALINLSENTEAQVMLVAMPLISAASVCGAGRLSGAAGSCNDALLWGAAGALPGIVMTGASYLIGTNSLSDVGFGLLISGVAMYFILPPFTAYAGYRRGAKPVIAPTALQHLDGDAIPGATLRLQF